MSPGVGAAAPSGMRPGRWPGIPTGQVRRSRRSRFLRARARRVLAALLVGIAAWTAVSAALPTPVLDGIPVLVATRDLPAGAQVATEDLRVVRVPPDAVPDRAVTDPATAAGAVLAGALGTGEVLTTTRLHGPGLLVGAPEGSVAVSVPVADPTILGSLRPGDRVRLLAVGTGAVVGEATVLVANSPTDDGGGLVITSARAGSLIAALDPQAAASMAAAQGPAGASGGFVVALLASGASRTGM